MKKFAYKTTRMTEHDDQIRPELCQIVGFDHLYNGEEIHVQEMLEKCRFFQKYSDSQGTYVTCNGKEHFYKWETLIKILSHPTCEENMVIRYSQGLYLEKV